MTDLRDKIAQTFSDTYIYGGKPLVEAADAILEIVEAQHRAELEAVREACAREATKGSFGDGSFWLRRAKGKAIRALDLDEILKANRGD